MHMCVCVCVVFFLGKNYLSQLTVIALLVENPSNTARSYHIGWGKCVFKRKNLMKSNNENSSTVKTIPIKVRGMPSSKINLMNLNLRQNILQEFPTILLLGILRNLTGIFLTMC